MPHAKILTKQALYALSQLHSELARKLSANKRETKRPRLAIFQVEAVMKMFSPEMNLRLIAPKRRNVGNPWFKRGTLARADIDTLRCLATARAGGRDRAGGKRRLAALRRVWACEVVALSRRRPRELHGARYVQADLTDAAQCAGAAAQLRGATHLVYAALYEGPNLVDGWRDERQIRTNDRMLRNQRTVLSSNNHGGKPRSSLPFQGALGQRMLG